jgi:hypothetical protein
MDTEQQQKDFLQKDFMQKDFMASFFPNDQPLDSHFPFTGGIQQQQQQQQQQHQQHQQQQQPQPTLNTQINMDLLMHMQGIDTTTPVSSQSSYNPQSLLEQQFKLTQLQQLQQLQNQIFQQQVRKHFYPYFKT